MLPHEAAGRHRVPVGQHGVHRCICHDAVGSCATAGDIAVFAVTQLLDARHVTDARRQQSNGAGAALLGGPGRHGKSTPSFPTTQRVRPT